MTIGALNQYTCDRCEVTITTIDFDEGTTPMLMGCRSGCGGTMHSHWYRINGDPEPEYEWFKPSLKWARRKGPEMLDHVKSGGLDIRPVSA